MIRPATPARTPWTASAKVAAEDLHVVLTTFGDLAIALDALSIASVDKQRTRPDGSPVPVVDLAALLDLDPPEVRRHLVNIGTAENGWDLLVGDSFRIEPISRSDLQSLPAFVSGLGERCLMGLLSRGQQFAFVVDLHCVRAASAPH